MGTMTPRASKSMDKCFHWLKCWHAQCQFQCLWQKGILNCTDFSSKHHAPKHHQNVCPFLFLTILHSSNSDRKCLPVIHDTTSLVIQCQHNGPLFLTTTQVDCPLARVCKSPSYPSWIRTCEPSSQLTWLLQNPQRNLIPITNSP
jgi:hypothetical protein